MVSWLGHYQSKHSAKVQVVEWLISVEVVEIVRFGVESWKLKNAFFQCSCRAGPVSMSPLGTWSRQLEMLIEGWVLSAHSQQYGVVRESWFASHCEMNFREIYVYLWLTITLLSSNIPVSLPGPGWRQILGWRYYPHIYLLKYQERVTYGFCLPCELPPLIL